MAFTNKAEFLGGIGLWLEHVEDKGENIVRKMARTALETAIQYSPYDTGRFIASWRITNGATHDAGPGKRSSLGAAAAEAEAASGAYIVSYRLGQRLSLTNGCPYANFIEYGAPTIRAHYTLQRAAAAAATAGSGGIGFFNFADEGVIEGDLGQ